MPPTNVHNDANTVSNSQQDQPTASPGGILGQLQQRFDIHGQFVPISCNPDDRIVYVPEHTLRTAIEFGLEPHDVREWVTERSAIAEFDGRRNRDEAEAVAIAELQSDLARRRHLRDHPQMELDFRT